MYTEIVKFRFNPKIAPSKRFEFLARLAEACEGALMRHPDHYYFAISVERSEECRVAFMMPSVYEIGVEQLRSAARDETLIITHPKSLAAEFGQTDAR